jgi:hypothetical protein
MIRSLTMAVAAAAGLTFSATVFAQQGPLGTAQAILDKAAAAVKAAANRGSVPLADM